MRGTSFGCITRCNIHDLSIVICSLCPCPCASGSDTTLSAPLNVTIREIEVNSAVVTWEILEGDPVIGFAITQQVPSFVLWEMRTFGQRLGQRFSEKIVGDRHGDLVVGFS